EYSPWETWSAGKKRGVACEIRIDARRKVQLVGVHLSHRSEALRIRSAEMLIDMAKESRYPLIVVGDLNSTPPDLPKAAFDEAGNNAMATFDKASQLQRIPISLPLTENDMTFHSSKPSRVIDWILIPPNWRFDEYQVIHSPLSDHRAVCADVSAGEVNSQASESPK
ncbi:MAG: endonuclease/exonuclease/phosphatase family metal-dependent hydrolase, partial [Pirellulaceae bacterium]